MKQPLILVTNDDGIHAPGIRHLISIVKEFGDVCVVAPDKPQSGMGHAITINSTLRLHKIKSEFDTIKEYACTGTPVDCVKLAIGRVLHRKPDLIVSGINHGSNSSISVIYSGTMSAAVEGAIEGIPSIGFSLCDYSAEANFNHATIYIKKIIQHALTNGIEKHTCLNVNFPATGKEPIAGIKVCRQAKAYWVEDFDERHDPSGKAYYWLTGHLSNPDKGEDTDEFALANNYASVVPVQFDLTAYQAIQNLKILES